MKKRTQLTPRPWSMGLAAIAASALLTNAASAATYTWGSGDVDILDGEPLISSTTGLWNTTTKNWTQDGGATYEAWVNGANTAHFRTLQSGTITIGEDIQANALIKTGGLSRTVFSAPSASGTMMLTLVGANPEIRWAGSDSNTHLFLSGPGFGVGRVLLADEGQGFTRSGATSTSAVVGIMATSPGVTGPVRVTGGVLGLLGGGLPNAASYTVSGNTAVLLVGGNQFPATTTANDKLNDAAPVTVTDGGFLRFAGKNSSYAETVGSLRVEGYGNLSLVGGDASNDGGTLILSDPSNGLVQGAPKSVLLVTPDGDNDGFLYVQNHTHGTGLLPWVVTNDGRFGNLANSGTLGYSATTDSTDLSTWNDSGVSFRGRAAGNAFTGSIPDDAAFNSLSISSTNNTGLSLTLSGSLHIVSGAVVIQQTDTGSTTVTGGTFYSGSGDLYMNMGGGGNSFSSVSTQTIDSVIGGGY